MASVVWLEHTADLRLQVAARTREELFTACAAALYEGMRLPAPREKNSCRSLAVAADNVEELLVRFLNELIYLFDTQRFAAASFRDLRIAPRQLTATAEGILCPAPALSGLREIKAATYHGLHYRETAAGSEATILFDL